MQHARYGEHARSELLQIAATGPASNSENSLRTQLGTESGPGALLVSSLHNCYSTFSSGITYLDATHGISNCR